MAAPSVSVPCGISQDRPCRPSDQATAECTSPADSQYRAFYLGAHDLGPGSSIWVQPNGIGAYGEVKATYVDRVFLRRG